MKSKIVLVLLVVSFCLVGCGSDKQIDDSKPAPAPQYKMVPSQKGGQ